ncbi:DUF1003 domain-containing protein [Streptomyces sp. NPDC002766]|uniref:DUF1003 domain-containing protein n=1 Tax=unclassified Streptomyces TaxID=2593676 RepID=UPI00332CFF4A
MDIGVFSPTTGPAGGLSRGGEAAVGAVGVHHRPRPLVPAESGVVGGSSWPTLTLVVSLEAIFLSTLVMIGQNRQAAFQQIKADHDFVEQELELKTDTPS